MLVAAANVTNQKSLVTIRVTSSDGRTLHETKWPLPGRNTRVLDLWQAVGRRAGFGGITIEHDGPPGAVMAHGLTAVATTGFSEAINFTDPSTQSESRLHGAGIFLGTIGTDNYSGRLQLRNVSNLPLTAAATIVSNGSKLTVAERTLSAGESAEFEVDPSSAAGGALGIEVENSGAPGSLIGKWASLGRSASMVVETPLRTVSNMLPQSGSNPFSLEGDNSVVLFLKNTGSAASKFLAIIAHPEGEYLLGGVDIQAGETIAIDIRRLRDSQAADPLGNVLPRTLVAGQVRWMNKGGPPLIGRTNILSSSKAVSSSMSCPWGCCSPRDMYMVVSPRNKTAKVGDQFSLQGQVHEVDCDYHDVVNPWHGATWGSWASGIASVSGGQVACHNPGVAQIYAESLGTIYGEVPPCEDDCTWESFCANPLSVPLYDEATVTSIKVSVTGVSAQADFIDIQLEPAVASGTFKLEYLTQGGTARTLVAATTRSGGGYRESFNIQNLVNGDLLRTLRATWTVDNVIAVGTANYAIDVLGDYRITCYNTPRETDHTGQSVSAGTADTTSGACSWAPRNFVDSFLDRVNLNGSGIDSSGTAMQIEFSCSNPPANCPQYCGRITPFNCERYRRPASIATSCGGAPIANVTAAVRPNHPSLGCGSNIVVHGIGPRTVQDNGGGLVVAQVDLFGGIGQAACAAWPSPTRKVIVIR